MFQVGDRVIVENCRAGTPEFELAAAGLVGTITKFESSGAAVVQFDYDELVSLDRRVADKLSNSKFGTWSCHEFDKNVGRRFWVSDLRYAFTLQDIDDVADLSLLFGGEVANG